MYIKYGCHPFTSIKYLSSIRMTDGWWKEGGGVIVFYQRCILKILQDSTLLFCGTEEIDSGWEDFNCVKQLGAVQYIKYTEGKQWIDSDSMCGKEFNYWVRLELPIWMTKNFFRKFLLNNQFIFKVFKEHCDYSHFLLKY